MSLFKQAIKIFDRVIWKQQTPFDASVEQQKKFLNALPEPMDDIDRAYAQYRCQMMLTKRPARLLYQLGAMLLLTVYRRRFRAAAAPERAESCDAVFLFAGDRGILPDCLCEEYPALRQIEKFQEHFLLTSDDDALLSQMRCRYPTAYFFRFKCMVKLAMYRYLYEAYRPRAFIVSEEYSYTSSLLTEYCHQLGAEHINVMHGEKLFYIRDSFFRFDRCYIWNELYRDLFVSLRAEPTQFCVELPPSLRPWSANGIDKTVDYTYYLQNESEKELGRIAASLHKLQAAGYTVAVRPHPLYSDKKAVEGLFADFIIENCVAIDIKTSILRTRHVVARYSTVLYQAYLNGVSMVIDDITLPQQYQKLEEVRFFGISVPHLRLGEVLKNNSPKTA